MRPRPTADELSPTGSEVGEAASAPGAVELEDHLPQGPADAEPFGRVGTRTAKPVHRVGRRVWVHVRGHADETPVDLDPEVDVEVVDDAIAAGDGVVVETTPHESPLLVGVITRRVSAHKVVRAERITVEAEDEILLRAGTSALRLRADGDVEVVGSRISATSRGLFRLVGRLLRLN